MTRLLLMFGLTVVATVAQAADTRRPNVVLIITDDQGYGDLGAHGNPVLQTPHLDRLARESAELTRFYVSPVCAPTRAALLTGRYNYRTGVTDTFLGRAMMEPREKTVAEYLSAAGYRTGIFGKWHLGDCFPMRAMDQGFQESLVHRGGGIGQPSDPPEATSYFDPVLFHNGNAERKQGYVSDVITDAAIAFVEQQARTAPFFVYLAFNAPHTPLEVPERYLAMYRDRDLSREAFPQAGQPLPERLDQEALARLYGMVTNIDDNVGRLLAALERHGVVDNTLVIFLTDNGPQGARYNAGLRGQKGSVYEGGIRVPMLVRWPGKIQAAQYAQPVAHIDVLPTILEACGVEQDEPAVDGRSFWPLVSGTSAEWPQRTLFAQWHRGDAPQRYRSCAAHDGRWKLVRNEPSSRDARMADEQFELYEVGSDPYEMHNVAAEKPAVVQRLKREYDRWFDDVCATRGFDPPRIVLGSAHENPTTLTRQDWRGDRAGWGPESIGQWYVELAEPGDYRFDVVLLKPVTGRLTLSVNDRKVATTALQASQLARLGPMVLEAGNATLQAMIETPRGVTGPHQIVVERAGTAR